MNPDYFEQTQEAYIAQECEAYGFNESGGLGPDGLDHCHSYKDTLDVEKVPE